MVRSENNVTFGCNTFAPGFGPGNDDGDDTGGVDAGYDDGLGEHDDDIDPPPPACDCYVKEKEEELSVVEWGSPLAGGRITTKIVTLVQDCGGAQEENEIEPSEVVSQMTAEGFGDIQGGDCEINQESCTCGEHPGDEEPGEEPECPECVIVGVKRETWGLGDGGGPGGPAGPGTPGPAGPGQPGGGGPTTGGAYNCECRVTTTLGPLSPTYDGCWKIEGRVFNQECFPQPPKGNAPSNIPVTDDSDEYKDYVQAQEDNPQREITEDGTTDPDYHKGCKSNNGGCNENCGPVTVLWRRWICADEEDVGDPTIREPRTGGGILETGEITGTGTVVVGADPHYFVGTCVQPYCVKGESDIEMWNFNSLEACEEEICAAWCPCDEGFTAGDDPAYPVGGITLPNQEPPGLFSTVKNVIKAGTALLKRSGRSKSIPQKARTSRRLDLNDGAVIADVLKKKPTGFVDNDIAIMTTPLSSEMVPNTTGYQMFGEKIDENILYVLKNNKQSANWDSRRANGVTVGSVIASLSPTVLDLFRSIKNVDGTPLSDREIYKIVGTRILDGTINKLKIRTIEDFANNSRKRNPLEIIKSSSRVVNETAALSLIESTYMSLDPAKTESKMKNILPNWKVFSTDIDKHIQIKNQAGVLKKYYIQDTNTFALGSRTVPIRDGDFIDIKKGDQTIRLFCQSEIDHAFHVPDKTKQKAITLLGGDPSRTLTVSAMDSDPVEYSYSLSDPRQDFYFLSANLSTVNTTFSPGSYLLKDTKINYDLVETSSVAGLASVNEYIRYKANSRTYILDHEDLIFDYLESGAALELSQTDILFDAPKTNKTLPLLTRQIPWYIILFPTNRTDYNIFNAKSSIVGYTPGGAIIRQVKTRPAIIPKFTKPLSKSKFAQQAFAYPKYKNVFGIEDTQARITEIFPDATVFKTGFTSRGKLGTAKEFTPVRHRTGIRLVKEIIEELDNNYNIDIDGLGKTLTYFDVISRLRMIQFNKYLRLENFTLLDGLVRNGLINGIKVFPAVKDASNQLSIRKTQLLSRKASAVAADSFSPVKMMDTGFSLKPPAKVAGAAFEPAPPRQPVNPT
jgi:hypothetical protein